MNDEGEVEKMKYTLVVKEKLCLFEKLPLELHLEMFSYLSPRDLVRIMTLSKELLSVVSTSFFLRRSHRGKRKEFGLAKRSSFKISDDDDQFFGTKIPSKSLLSLLKECKQGIDRIDLSSEHMTMSEELLQEVLLIANKTKGFGKLAINIKGIHGKVLLGSIKKCTSLHSCLRELLLSNVNLQLVDIHSLLCSFQKLKVLKLSNVRGNPLYPRNKEVAKELSTLTLVHIRQFSKDLFSCADFTSTDKSSPLRLNLEEIEMINVDDPGIVVYLLLSLGNNLKRMTIVNERNNAFVGFCSKNFARFKQLQSIFIKGKRLSFRGKVSFPQGLLDFGLIRGDETSKQGYCFKDPESFSFDKKIFLRTLSFSSGYEYFLLDLPSARVKKLQVGYFDMSTNSYLCKTHDFGLLETVNLFASQFSDELYLKLLISSPKLQSMKFQQVEFIENKKVEFADMKEAGTNNLRNISFLSCKNISDSAIVHTFQYFSGGVQRIRFDRSNFRNVSEILSSKKQWKFDFKQLCSFRVEFCHGASNLIQLLDRSTANFPSLKELSFSESSLADRIVKPRMQLKERKSESKTSFYVRPYGVIGEILQKSRVLKKFSAEYIPLTTLKHVPSSIKELVLNGTWIFENELSGINRFKGLECLKMISPPVIKLISVAKSIFIPSIREVHIGIKSTNPKILNELFLYLQKSKKNLELLFITASTNPGLETDSEIVKSFIKSQTKLKCFVLECTPRPLKEEELDSLLDSIREQKRIPPKCRFIGGPKKGSTGLKDDCKIL